MKNAISRFLKYPIAMVIVFSLLFLTACGNSDDSTDNITTNNPTPQVVNPKVYVNGLKVEDYRIFLSEGEFYANTSTQVISLREWASQNGYTYLTNSNRLYLNNDGNLPIEVTINGELIDFPSQQPITLAPGRTMVPIRPLDEVLECTIDWDGAHRMVIIQKETSLLLMELDSMSYWKDGEYYYMDIAPTILNGLPLIPIHYVAKTLGFNVEFDGTGPIALVKLSS